MSAQTDLADLRTHYASLRESVTALQQLAEEQARVIAELQASRKERIGPFGLADAQFLTWVLGFTAGANLERDGERGERIFGRCREILEQLQPVEPNPS